MHIPKCQRYSFFILTYYTSTISYSSVLQHTADKTSLTNYTISVCSKYEKWLDRHVRKYFDVPVCPFAYNFTPLHVPVRTYHKICWQFSLPVVAFPFSAPPGKSITINVQRTFSKYSKDMLCILLHFFFYYLSTDWCVHFLWIMNFA